MMHFIISGHYFIGDTRVQVTRECEMSEEIVLSLFSLGVDEEGLMRVVLEGVISNEKIGVYEFKVYVDSWVWLEKEFRALRDTRIFRLDALLMTCI